MEQARLDLTVHIYCIFLFAPGRLSPDPEIVSCCDAVSHRPLPRRALAALLACALGALAGCEGSRGATPLPEPPALDGDRIDLPEVMPASQDLISVVGASRSATPGSTVRVTNLDTTDEPATALVESDGSFVVQVRATRGDELRFEAEKNGERSDALDFIVDVPLEPSPRHDCIRIDPEFRLEFLDSPDTQQIFVQSTCDEAASLDNARTRLSRDEFTISGDFPLDLAARDDAAFDIDFDGESPAEDVLFVDIELNGVSIRYPITLRAR